MRCGRSRKKRSRSAPLDIYYFCWVKQSRHPGRIAQSCAHDQPALIHTLRISRPPALAGGKHTSIKKSPLAAVCMNAEDQIYILIFQQRPVFRMVREYDFISGLRGKRRYPVCFWLMSSGAGGTSDAVQILSAWITRLGGLCGAEGAVIYDISAG